MPVAEPHDKLFNASFIRGHQAIAEQAPGFINIREGDRHGALPQRLSLDDGAFAFHLTICVAQP
jgi:hypothetical protein